MLKIWKTPAIKCPVLFEELLSKNDFNGLYMNTILAQRIGNDDERIPRNIAP